MKLLNVSLHVLVLFLSLASSGLLLLELTKFLAPLLNRPLVSYDHNRLVALIFAAALCWAVLLVCW